DHIPVTSKTSSVLNLSDKPLSRLNEQILSDQNHGETKPLFNFQHPFAGARQAAERAATSAERDHHRAHPDGEHKQDSRTKEKIALRADISQRGSQRWGSAGADDQP